MHISENVRERLPANQRAGTDRLSESRYLFNGRGALAGQASSGGWAAWNLLLSLIKVAPELVVNALDAGAIYETVRDSYIGCTHGSTAEGECLLRIQPPYQCKCKS